MAVTSNADLIGRHVLVGLTYESSTSEPDHVVQLHGTVTRADVDGIVIRVA